MTAKDKAQAAALGASIFDQVFYAVVGQILLPIPVVGALVGWLASGFLPGPGDVFGFFYCRKIAKDEYIQHLEHQPEDPS